MARKLKGTCNIRAWQIYEVLQCWLDSRSYPPTIRELAVACGIRSYSNVHLYLGRLREAGLVTWVSGFSRTLAVLQ